MFEGRRGYSRAMTVTDLARGAGENVGDGSRDVRKKTSK